MMLQYFQMLESRLDAKIKKTPDKPNARRKFALEIAKLGTRLYSGEHRVAWCGVVAPFDMLSAMNVTSCFVEFVGAMLAATGNVGMFLEESEHAGFGADTCGYHRAVIGAALKGLMPVPDVMIATTCPCTGGLAAMENLARMFNKELFVLDVPSSDTPESVQYLANQYKDMIRFIGSRTGESLDEDQLRVGDREVKPGTGVDGRGIPFGGECPVPVQRTKPCQFRDSHGPVPRDGRGNRDSAGLYRRIRRDDPKRTKRSTRRKD